MKLHTHHAQEVIIADAEVKSTKLIQSFAGEKRRKEMNSKQREEIEPLTEKESQQRLGTMGKLDYSDDFSNLVCAVCCLEVLPSF